MTLLLLLNASLTSAGYVEGAGTTARILQHTPAPIGVVFFDAGVPSDPGPVTVTVTRADGTVVYADVLAGGGGSDPSTLDLSISDTSLLDELTITWVSEPLGTIRSVVEVVGGFLCALSTLQAALPTETIERLGALRVGVEQQLERELGYACVPRYAHERLHARQGRVMTREPLRAVRSLTVDPAWGSAARVFSPGEVALLGVEPWGVNGIRYEGPVTIGYEHGLDGPGMDVAEAMILLVDEKHGTSTVDGRRVDNMGQPLIPGTGGPFVGAQLNQIVRSNRLIPIA